MTQFFPIIFSQAICPEDSFNNFPESLAVFARTENHGNCVHVQNLLLQLNPQTYLIMLFLLQFLLIAMINVVKTSGRGANSVLAPYYSSNNRLVLDTYIVRLSQNHTLAKHFAYCGVNLSNANQGFEEIAAIHR